MIVRKASITDIAPLMRLDRAFQDKTGEAEYSSEQWAHHIQNDTVLCSLRWKWHQGFLVATQDDSGDFTIQKAFVARPSRFKGMGKGLMRAFTEIQKSSLSNAFLFVADDNDHAIDFYNRHGFEISHHDADYLMTRACD